MQLRQDKMENFKIIYEIENLLFFRKEIKIEVESEITPSKVEVEKFLNEKFSISPGTLKLDKIKGRFGSKKFEITAKIYMTEQNKNQIETKTKKQRDAEKKALEETKKAELEENAKVEEKIEENKIEEVKK